MVIMPVATPKPARTPAATQLQNPSPNFLQHSPAFTTFGVIHLRSLSLTSEALKSLFTPTLPSTPQSDSKAVRRRKKLFREPRTNLLRLVTPSIEHMNGQFQSH